MAKKSAKSAKGAKKKAAKSVKSAKSVARKGAAKKSAKGARKAPGRGRANAAFMAPVTPDSALAAVVGDKPMPRTEITKRLWAYIKKNDLQDQKNRRMINADGSLKPVFGGKATVNMFEMTKLVNKHVKA
jgi:upstream activation factor subunit UAF30